MSYPGPNYPLGYPAGGYPVQYTTTTTTLPTTVNNVPVANNVYIDPGMNS